MHDTDTIAILLATLAVSILPAYLLRRFNRVELSNRLRRSLRLAVGRELEPEAEEDLVHRRRWRRRPGTGGEDMAA